MRIPMTVESLPERSHQLRGLIASGLETLFIRCMTAGGAFLLAVVVARTSSEADFGEFSVCFLLLTMLSMVARFGTDASLLRFGGAAWHEANWDLFSDYARLSLAITTRMSLAIMLLGTLGVTLLWNHWDASATFSWTLVGLLPWSLNFTISYVFKAAQRPQVGTCFEPGTVCMITAAIVLGCAGVGFHMTASSIIVAQSLVACLLCLFGFYLAWQSGLLRPRRTTTPRIEKRSFQLTSANFLIVVLMQVLANQGGILFLEHQGDQTELAMFSAAVRVSTLTILVLNVVVLVVSPRLAGLYKSSPGQEFERLAHQASQAAFLACALPLMILLIGSQFVMGVFGQAYMEHSHLLRIIALGQLVGTITALAPALLSMTGHDQELRNSTILISLVSIVLSVLLIRWYGAYGAAIATALYQALQSTATAWIVRRKLGFWPILNGSAIMGISRRLPRDFR